MHKSCTSRARGVKPDGTGGKGSCSTWKRVAVSSSCVVIDGGGGEPSSAQGWVAHACASADRPLLSPTACPTCELSRRCGRRRRSVQPAPMRSPRNRRTAGLRLRQSCDTAALVGRIARIAWLSASMKSGVAPAPPPVYPRLPPLDPARLPDSPLGRWPDDSRCSFGGRGMGDMARGGGGGVETRTRPLRMPMTSQSIWPRENKAPIKRR